LKDYRNLLVWQRSHSLVLAIYAATKQFPKDEMFGLTSQLRRASASIPANLAEGCGRDSDAELKRFIDIAHGSASEVEYFIMLAHQLGYLIESDHGRLTDEIGQIKKMLGAFARKLKADR
jgi:four helix bundle protein